ncbi:STAS/SEC14 domain-containing protein [Gramella sp. AN32]|uniref:STAS/SEC14 domain-containing protein n=1 Tax=Christiangramia antarctica TaxID=2058158 RepID=A0ABW5X335_9FLAO|nr:STAS/SEC14 domain-containing protein [Gramella sp. AN32]MCM4156267.1 hypothetical protein [Gramella sp. AN32]
MISSFDLAGHVYGIMINSDMTKEVMQESIAKIDEKLLDHEVINLYFEVEKGKRIEFDGFMECLKYKYAHAKHFNKIPVVSDNKKFQMAVGISDVFLSIDVRTFDLKERIEAIQWISE